MKKRIMVFCDSFPPGYRGGGGMWMVSNLVDRLADRFDLFVVTRNCDGKLDATPYIDIRPDRWLKRNGVTIIYLSPGRLNRRQFRDLIIETGPDLIFLNSLFSRTSAKLLFSRRRGDIRKIPLMIAPCGELAPTALSLKGFKKRMFLSFAKRFRIFENAVWKVSIEREANDVRSVIGAGVDIQVAGDMTPREILPDFETSQKIEKSPGSVRFAVVSRISENKNIHFLLKLLRNVKSAKIDLTIIGPKDDRSYFELCSSLADEIAQNVTVKFVGPVLNHETLKMLVASHFLLLPTLNENFGFAVIEALAAGCPVVASDRTAWNDIREKGCGWLLSPHNSDAWIDRLHECVAMDSGRYRDMSSTSRQYAVKWLSANRIEQANLAAIEYALSRRRGDDNE